MLWGGRFKEELNSDALKFSTSINFDINLIYEDLFASKVHAEMLSEINVISKDEFEKIANGLNRIETEFKQNVWTPDYNKFEDIHSAIESRLYELIGNVAGKLHTARSRDDQVITAMRLWVKNSCEKIISEIKNLQKIFLEISKDHTETIIPGYTHLQRAQPISFAFHLLAYVEMFERDKERFLFTKNEAMKLSPLGSGALAGSTIPLDRNFTSKKMGFENPSRNALDSVSDRDFLIDFLNSCVIGMMHLSRLSEEIILWSSAEWKFVKISDKFSTGSSLMPQKKNPDMAELIRGKSGRVYGNYISLITALKGLPLSYNRDLQEDKEPVFDSFNTYFNSLSIMNGMISTMKINSERFLEELKGDFSLATDLADWLVLKNIPFREAHEIVGKVVKYLEENNKKFDEINLEELKNINSIFDESALECFEIISSIKRKKTYGSPNPKLILEQIEFWYEIL